MTSAPSLLPVYRACIKEAAAQGRDLMQRAILRAQGTTAGRLARAADPLERQLVHDALQLLARHEGALSVAYPQALLAEFSLAIAGNGTPRPAGTLSFAELELVDDDQVQEGVEVLRTQQAVASAVEGELVQLNALVCAAQGLRNVQSDRNPLRPDAYVRSLRTVVQQSPVPARVRTRWLQFLGEALGPELAHDYGRLSASLRAQGVSGAGFQIVASAPARAPGAADAAAAPQPSTLLTIRSLQRLLSGELEPDAPGGARGGAHAPAPAGANGAPATAFAETLPAAFEVLQEIRHVDAVMRRLRQREREAGQGTAGLREALKSEVHRPGQALALEVVSLMVENLAGDERLLQPVRQALLALEPALLRLALADPRFFSDRLHPARRFLDEMTTRSLAWQSEREPGFDAFITPLREAVDALVATHVTGSEPYGFALHTLEDTWTRTQSRERRQREKAVRALLKAEQRNLLASRLATEMQGRNDLALAPPEVAAFLLGPWPQVMAQAQLGDTEGRQDPGGFRAAVPELLWSVLPHTTPAAAARLGRRLPALVETIRQGLQLVGYGQVQVRHFLDRLADLHQRALKGTPAQPHDADSLARGRQELEGLLGPALEGGSWLAPDEAQQTGFMDSALATGQPLFQATEGPGSLVSGADGSPPELPAALQAGSWVDLQLEGGASRWQLSWISPHGTLLMFTGASGRTQSMTPRLAATMVQAGTLRLVSGAAVVDGALDAVAQAALRNSAERPGS
ncbi:MULTISPECIES: DUF1631 family protein [Ramlibacter]|uniref:DUF1631 family protein n=1 Tax=Ramlibacter TaxID=174951 RepID=UPI0012F895FB|nr:DUF1631 family protein [Ramlibacter sp. CGMCC 1.13660]